MHSLLRPGVSARILFLSLVVLLLPLLPAAAEDPAETDDYVVRIFQVGALTAGRSNFIGGRAPPVGPDDVSDETQPFFGQTEEEPTYPFGQVDDLMELVRTLARPEAWQDRKDGAIMRALGDHAILVKHRPQVLDEVARVLADLEQRALTTVTVELRAVRSSADARGKASAAPDSTPHSTPHSSMDPAHQFQGPALSLTGFVGQRIAGFSGRRAAYLIDYDVEVDKNVTTSDPIVTVANLGLRADLQVVQSAGSELLRVDVRAWLADVAATREVSTGANRTIEAWDFDLTLAYGPVKAQPRVWTAVAGCRGEAGWSLFVRATPHAWAAHAATPPSLHIPAPIGEINAGVLQDVRDLTQRLSSYRIEEGTLTPSNFTPLEPPDLQEPVAAFEADDLIAVLKQASPTATWSKRSMNSAGPGMLYARNTPNVLAGLKAMLGTLRAQTLVSLRTHVQLLELPATLLDRLRASDAGERLVDRALKAGTARRLVRLELVNRPGVRNAVMAGRSISYLADYEVEIAEGAEIANPVVQNILAAAQLDLRAHLTGDARGVALALRFEKSEPVTPIRSVATPAGSLMMPELRVFRLRTGMVVPLGRTVVIGARGDGPTRQALLLTTRLVRGP